MTSTCARRTATGVTAPAVVRVPSLRDDPTERPCYRDSTSTSPSTPVITLKLRS
jgi:hypothetical protein